MDNLELTPVDSKLQMEEFIEASRLVTFMQRIYPAYRWTICKDTRGGVYKIAEVNLMQTEIPYILKINDVKHSEKALRKALIAAGGEILERFGMARDERSGKRAEMKMNDLPTDYKGNFLFDAAGVPNWIGERSKS